MPSRAEKERRRAAGRSAPAAQVAPPAPPAPPARRASPRALVAAGLLLAVFAAQALIAARRDSVTIDEFNNLPTGLNQLYTGDLREDPINTHLPRMIAALPVLAEHPVFSPPAGAVVWGQAYYFMQTNAERYQQIFVTARSAIVLLSLLAANTGAAL